MKKSVGKHAKVADLSPDGYHYKPTLSLTSKDLPEVKDWKIDGEYTLQVKVKMSRISHNEYSSGMGGSEPMQASFSIEDVKVIPNKKRIDEIKENKGY